MDRRGKGQSIVQSAEAATDPYEIQYKVIERVIFTVSLCCLFLYGIALTYLDSIIVHILMAKCGSLQLKTLNKRFTFPKAPHLL